MDPNDVFLSADGGWRRSFASGKKATVAVHDNFASYCARLAALIANATAATSSPSRAIFLVGLEFMMNLRLDKPTVIWKPGDSDKDKTLGGLLEAAVKAKVTVRMLFGGGEVVDGVNELAAAKALGIDAVLDEQRMDDHPFHQKAAYVRPGDGPDHNPIFFVGGMDLAAGSWNRNDWFDTMAEISGADGARLGAATLEERWQSVVNHQKLTTAGVATGVKPAWSAGEALVSYVRTYGLSVKDEGVLRNKKNMREYEEEHSYVDVLLRAIPKARESIYIEDQFFENYREVDEALAAAINQDDGPTVVVIASRINETGRKSRTVGKLRQLTQNRHRLHLLRLKEHDGRKPNLIHTKAWVFDDEIALVGSANYWYWSYARPHIRIDSELGALFMAPVVKDLRVQLWNRMIASGKTGTNPTNPATVTRGKFFDELGTLMDRTAKEVQTNTQPFLTTGGRSEFEAIPDVETA